MIKSRAANILSYLRRNPRLAIGLALMAAILLFSGVGSLLVDAKQARPLSAPPSDLHRSNTHLAQINLAET